MRWLLFACVMLLVVTGHVAVSSVALATVFYVYGFTLIVLSGLGFLHISRPQR